MIVTVDTAPPLEESLNSLFPPPESEVKVMSKEPSVVGLLNWSCRCTTKAVLSEPALTVDGLVVIANLLEVSGLIVTEDEEPGVKPPAEASTV